MSHSVRFNIPDSIIGNLGESLQIGGEEENEDENADEDDVHAIPMVDMVSESEQPENEASSSTRTYPSAHLPVELHSGAQPSIEYS